MSKIITEAAKLDDAIVRVNKAANGLAGAIQAVLVGAAYQAIHGRNTNHLNALQLAVGKGVRKTAMAQWILAHAPVVLETDKEKQKESPYRFNAEKLEKLLPEAANAKSITAEEALAYAESIIGKDWTEHKEPPLVPEKWDAMAAIKKLIAQGQGYQKKGTKIDHADLLGKLGALIATPGDGKDIAGV